MALFLAFKAFATAATCWYIARKLVAITAIVALLTTTASAARISLLIGYLNAKRAILFLHLVYCKVRHLLLGILDEGEALLVLD